MALSRTQNQAHRFLGDLNTGAPPKPKRDAARDPGLEDDFDESQRKDDAEKHAGSRDGDVGNRPE